MTTKPLETLVALAKQGASLLRAITRTTARAITRVITRVITRIAQRLFTRTAPTNRCSDSLIHPPHPMRPLTFSDPAFTSGNFTAAVDALSAGVLAGNLGAGATSVLIGTITADGIGSVGPYTYSWSRRSGSTEIAPVDSNIAAAVFRWIGTVGAGGFHSAVFVCTATSSTGKTTVSAPVTLDAEVYPGDPP